MDGHDKTNKCFSAALKRSSKSRQKQDLGGEGGNFSVVYFTTLSQ
jgi:hypothetical protein